VDGAYSEHLDYHNYGYTLKYNCQINLAVYDAKLIFHLRLPNWDVTFNNTDFACRELPQRRNRGNDCGSARPIMTTSKRVRQMTQKYVQSMVRRIHDVVLDMPIESRGRVTRGVFTNLLSRITGLASQDDVRAVFNIVVQMEQGVYEAAKLWGDGSRKLAAAFSLNNQRIENVMKILAEERRNIRDIQREFSVYNRGQNTWMSEVVAETLTFLDDEMWHRQEVDNLYNAVQQLMAGSIPHFILSHSALTQALIRVQQHLDEIQPHLTLSRHDYAYYYTQATFKSFRRGSVLFLVIDAPVVFRSLAMPFNLYDVVKFPLTTHHQHDFYTTLKTDITALAFNPDADYFVQVSPTHQRPQGKIWYMTEASALFIDRSKPTCGRGLLIGSLSEIKSECGYLVQRAPYPRGVTRLFGNTFLLVNISTLKIQCFGNPQANGTAANSSAVQSLPVNKPVVIKTFDCNCENVVADEFRILIDLTYCNGSDNLFTSMDVQFPVNLAYLTEYFDLEILYNLTAQTLLNHQLEVLLPDLSTADKLWTEAMAFETSARFDMSEIINSTKQSTKVYDNLAHYLFNQMLQAHDTRGEFDFFSPWTWLTILGWIVSGVALVLVVMLRIKVRSLSMLLMARAAHAAPAKELPKLMALTAAPTPDTQPAVDMMKQWIEHMSHVPNLLPAEVLILLTLILWILFKLGRMLYLAYKEKTARTSLILEIGNATESVLLPIMDLPHASRYYRLMINRQEIQFHLVESNVGGRLAWGRGIALSNSALEMTLPLPPRLYVPHWKVKKLKSLLQVPYYAVIQIVSEVTTREMEIVVLKSMPIEMHRHVYPQLPPMAMPLN